MTIGEKIKQARKKANLTQGELGKKLGVSAAMVAQYEKGVRNPKWETLRNIANALNVETGSLIGDWDDCSTNKDSISVDRPKIQEAINIHPNMQLTQESFKYESKKILLNSAFDSLNDAGQDKAIEQVVLLTKIPEYQKETEE